MTARMLLRLLLLLPLSGLAQTDGPDDYLPPSFHAGRREAARALMPEHSVMVVFSSPVRNYANDVDYAYHPNPDLYYFTGYKEPNAVLFLFKNPQTGPDGATYNELIFVQERDPRAEQWNGRRLGYEGVRKNLGIASAYGLSQFPKFALGLDRCSTIISPLLPDDATDRSGNGDLNKLITGFVQAAGRPIGKDGSGLDFRKYRQITGLLREVKTPEEEALIRKAVEISCQGQNEVMKLVRPNMSEREIQGLHEYVHKRYGAESVGYGSIIGAGDNGCILHYVENNRMKVGASTLLMDVGAEYHGYTADVTRTIPADGTFSPEERAVYQIVYDAQESAFALLKEGVRWSDVSAAAAKTIAEGLKKLGLITKDEEARRYYPHGLGHHIGLDVHDRSATPTMKKGMVMTVEPGIYIPPNSPCDPKWWGIAVRIEDDVLINEKGYELLSRFAPRSIAEIEKMMKTASGLESFKLPPLESARKKDF